MSNNYLSHDEIIEAVRQGEIKIAYYAVEQASKLAERRYVKVDARPADDDIDKKIRAYFLSNVQPDSLTIHVGPYASVEDAKAKGRRGHVEVRNGQTILNIAKTGRILLAAGEFSLIGSNEYIAVGNKIGASLCANVRNTDVGLSHISTIIDPTWEGKLQIGITNTTRVSKELEFLDALCIARFHRLSREVPPTVADKFRSERPHYGLDWWSVERDRGRSYFPVRKEYEENESGDRRNKGELRKQRVLAFFKRAGAIVGGISVVGVFTAFLQGYDLYKLYEDIPQKVSQLENDSQQLKKSTGDVDKILKTFHVIQSGSHRVQIGDPSTYTFGVNFDRALDKPPVLLVGMEGLESSEYTTTVRYNREANATRSIVGATISVRPTKLRGTRRELIATWLAARHGDTVP